MKLPAPKFTGQAEAERKYTTFWWKLLFELGAIVLLFAYFALAAD